MENANIETKQEEEARIDLGLYYTKKDIRELDHGYSEAPTQYNMQYTGEKVILDSEGKFVRTVGVGFTLLTHEQLKEKLQERWQIENEYYSIARGLSKAPRRATFEIKTGNNTSVLINNSIDGTIALSALAKVNDSILAGKAFERVYRMHTEKFSLDDMAKAIEAVGQHTAEYKEILAGLEKLNIKDNIEFIEEMQKEMLLAGMPKKYAQEIIDKAKIGMDGLVTMENLYSRMSKDIWASDVDMKRKIELFKLLNDYCFTSWIAGGEKQ